MDSKLFGGILLVIGTTIGAGMLALPVATAPLGFTGSVTLLTAAWVLMTVCAFIFLEVTLWLPPNTNLVSMAGATLGVVGQAVTWFFYLLLLYSIISAYIAGGGDIFHYLFASIDIAMPQAIASILFTVTLGVVVYYGIRAVDYVNRGLMFGKMGAYVLLVALIYPFISFDRLAQMEMGSLHTSSSSFTVTAVAFGSLMIVPSLRTYFDNNHRSLCIAILVGMFIPLLCYIAWDMAIMGVIPFAGPGGLQMMLHSSSSNSDMIAALHHILQSPFLTMTAKFFTSICMATSFLSVSLSLSDFLADGFGVVKKGWGNVLVFSFTFLPPLAIVLFYPDAFIRALQYAGLSVIVLMVFLPPLMAWIGRNDKDLPRGDFQVRGGKFLLGMIIIISIILIYFSLAEHMQWLWTKINLGT